MYKLNWSGLADAKYYEYIAKYCIPSWASLPGSKYVVHDSNLIAIDNIAVIDWDRVPNLDALFLKNSSKTKPYNFWRKMQSQVWAVRNLTDCDFLILLDTDIEVLNFVEDEFNTELEKFKSSGMIWATGETQRKKVDSGFVIFNMSHPTLSELVAYYENIWESGDIFNLPKSYDGDAVQSMMEVYPSYKIKTRDYGSGMHLYDLGFVHWGSKEPKQLRAEWNGTGSELVEKRLSEIVIKKYKSE